MHTHADIGVFLQVRADGKGCRGEFRGQRGFQHFCIAKIIFCRRPQAQELGACGGWFQPHTLHRHVCGEKILTVEPARGMLRPRGSCSITGSAGPFRRPCRDLQ